jgi:hypothetical protein
MAYITFQPSDYFNTKLYTGNGSTNAITGVGFQPDWVWIKARGATTDHVLYDVVRGVTKNLHSNTTDVEDTQTDGLTAFGTDGFTVGADSKSNLNSGTFASWNWKAGGSSSTNNDGSVASTVSANTTAGISIVKWTANISSAISVGHGLGVAPKVIIQKALGVAANWVAGGFGLSWNGYIIPSATNAFNDSGDASTGTGRFFKAGGTEPTSSVFHTNSSALIGSASDMIAFCFAEKKGYSKFGSYTGNGNADGAFIYTGFKPALVIVKRSSAVEDWKMFDNKRPGYNLTNLRLKPNGSETEASSGGFDFTSNGFKARSTDAAENASGSTYIYMAFAEEPLVSSNNIPCTAR